MGKRDRDVGRHYPSGSTKRKAKAERNAAAEETISKTRKLTEYFTTSKDEETQKEITSDDDENETAVYANQGREPSEEINLQTLCSENSTVDDSTTGSLASSQQHGESTSQGRNDQVPLEELSPYLCDDLGAWPKKPNKDFREHWILQGSDKCQHANADFSTSMKLYENEKKPRFCQGAYFNYVHNPTNTIHRRTWLCYSPSTGKVFCFPCKLVAEEESIFSVNGFNDWKHATEYLKRHEDGSVHKKALMTLVVRQDRKQRIDSSLIAQIETEQRYWRKFLLRVVEVVKFLAERGLPFRGKDEIIGSQHNGNYLGILELIAKFDPFLETHINQYGNKGTGSASYLSKTVCEEFIEIIGSKMLAHIVEDVKKFKYFSVSLDSTPDVSHVDQLTLILRYVSPDGPIERFLKLLPMEGHTAEKISKSLLTFLVEQGIKIEDCRGQSYDNASNMSGKYRGVQALIKRVNPKACYIPCFAHSLNLVGKHAADCCQEASKFFLYLESLYTFFSGSTHRWNLLKLTLNKMGSNFHTLKDLSDTRWSSRADATKALRENFQSVKEALCELADNTDQKSETRQRARGLVRGMENLETGIMLIMWNKILERFESTSAALQASDQNLNTSFSLYKSLHGFVEHNIKPTFTDIEIEAMDLTGCNVYQCEIRRRRKKNPKYLDKPARSDTKTPSKKFQTETFDVIIDSLLSELSKRTAAYSTLNEQFGFLRELKQLSPEEIKEASGRFISVYPEDVDSNLSNELVQFSHLLKTDLASHLDTSDQLKELEMYKLITKHSLEACFANLEVVLRIFLCLMVTNCSGERSFSKLKRIKDLQRNCIGQERLNNLMLMSVEHELLREIDVSSIIDEFANAKCRKQPM